MFKLIFIYIIIIIIIALHCKATHSLILSISYEY